jgi:U4/U6.U5 tri-snRNP-associated protein 1
MKTFSAIPQAAEYFDSQPIMKGKSKKPKKKKSNTTNIASDAQEAGASFVTLPALQTATNTSSDLNGASSSAPKPGFSKISIFAAGHSLPSQHGTPVPGDRTKVAFRLATKRKADGDLMETSPPLKR